MRDGGDGKRIDGFGGRIIRSNIECDLLCGIAFSVYVLRSFMTCIELGLQTSNLAAELLLVRSDIHPCRIAQRFIKAYGGMELIVESISQGMGG